MNPPAELTELTEINTMLPSLKSMPATLKTLQTNLDTLTDQVSQLRRSTLSRSNAPRPSTPGQVSDDCAARLGASFIAHCEKSRRTELLCSPSVQRDALVESARQTFGLTTRAALSTTEVPLPIQYAGEIRELISQFGVVRSHMAHYPIGMGVAKPARMGTRPAFASSPCPQPLGSFSNQTSSGRKTWRARDVGSFARRSCSRCLGQELATGVAVAVGEEPTANGQGHGS